MAIEARVIEIWEGSVDHGGRSSPGVVIKASNNGAVTLEHFTDRTQVVAAVIIRCAAPELALPIREDDDRITGVAQLALFHPRPNKFPRGGDAVASFLDDLHTPAQSIIRELAALCRSSVVDGHEPVGPVPLKCPSGTVVNQAAVGVVGERTIVRPTLLINSTSVSGFKCTSSSGPLLSAEFEG